jgi:hypothetical protein
MKVKPITQDMLRGLKYSPQTGLIYRTDYISGKIKMRPVLTKNSSGYKVIAINKKQYLQHRVAHKLMGVDIPDGMCVDHINGVRYDNRWCNLRVATLSENQLNKKRHREGGEPFIVKYVGTFAVKKSIGNVRAHFGNYKTTEAAIARRDSLIKKGWPLSEAKHRKNIYFDKQINKWRIQKKIGGKKVSFGIFKHEEDAIKQRDILVKEGWPLSRKPKIKNIHFNKNNNRWVVSKIINQKSIHYGSYKTKEEAIKERDRLESCNWVKREPKKPEYMTLDKRSGSWVVCKGKVFYGQFKAKEQAIKRRDELIANGWKK